MPEEGSLPPGGSMSPFLHGVRLSEVQRDKIFLMEHTAAPQLRDDAKAVRKSREDLAALALSGQYSDARAKAIADAGAKAFADMAVLRFRIDSQIYALLSAEQRKQVGDARARFDRRRTEEPGAGPR